MAWVDGTRRNVRLRLSPIDVGPVLSAALWGEVTAVLTSATVPPRLVERVGLEGFETNQLNVGSPFDYRAHALLYVARHLPDRRAPQAEAALHKELALLIEAAGGRTLALFTSRRATEEAAAALAPDSALHSCCLQGELPKGRLLEEFAADETSCLFATLGFWQGVDIPGRALSLVTLDRLPFPRPDDPLLQARRARAGSRAFQLVDLPRAATLLAQGAGRLIRTAEDRGVVAVLDPRLATASYRDVLLSTLPPMRRTVERADGRGVPAGGPGPAEPGRSDRGHHERDRRRGRDDVVERQSGALEELAVLVFGALEAAGHGQHGQVQHFGHVRLVAGGHDRLQGDDRRSRLRRLADVLQDLARPLVVPVVEDDGQQVGVRPGGHGFEEVARLRAATGRRAHVP